MEEGTTSQPKPLKVLFSPTEPPNGFDGLSYFIEPSLENFNLNAFRAYFRDHVPDGSSWNLKSASVAIAPRDGQAGPFQIHLRWTVRRNSVDFAVEYWKGPRKHESDETEPYAEEFMQWFGQFFKNDTTQAHVHGYFKYSETPRVSRVPIPVKFVGIEGEPEMDGVSLRFHSKPHGVTQMRLTKRGESWYVEVMGELRIAFKSSTAPYSDARVLAKVVDTILEVKH